jgi:alpha-1,3-glucosyltransferase
MSSKDINNIASTVYFQRATVMISELPFLIVLYLITRKVNITLVLAYFSIPFIILDSNTSFIADIHFQYNIIMQALFLLSVYLIQEGKFLQGAFAFSTLLNFKHIYLYASIAFVAYLLK